jgi:ABC-type branched-subunit amino acid transport system permease subunit
VLEVIDSQVGRYTEHSLLAVGALALLVGMFFPQGLMGLLRGRFAWRPFWPFARPTVPPSD